jgi:hypothetical protein
MGYEFEVLKLVDSLEDHLISMLTKVEDWDIGALNVLKEDRVISLLLIVSKDVEDLGLVWFHALHIIIKGDPTVGEATLESHQLEDAITLLTITKHALLKEHVEILVPGEIGLLIFLRFIIKHLKNSLSENTPQLSDETRVLIVLSRDVEREILTIHNTLHKS